MHVYQLFMVHLLAIIQFNNYPSPPSQFHQALLRNKELPQVSVCVALCSLLLLTWPEEGLVTPPHLQTITKASEQNKYNTLSEWCKWGGQSNSGVQQWELWFTRWKTASWNCRVVNQFTLVLHKTTRFLVVSSFRNEEKWRKEQGSYLFGCFIQDTKLYVPWRVHYGIYCTRGGSRSKYSTRRSRVPQDPTLSTNKSRSAQDLWYINWFIVWCHRWFEFILAFNGEFE